MAVCLSSCTEKSNGDTGTESTVSVTESASIAETEAEETEKTSLETEKETDITVSETKTALERDQKEIYPSQYFEDNGYDFLSHLDMLRVDMDNFSDEVKPLTGLDSKYLDAVIGIEVHNAQDADLSFISECKNLKRLTLLEYSGDIHSLIELLKAYNIKSVSVCPVNYSSADAKLLMTEFDGWVKYIMDDSPWRELDKTPTEGFVFYVNPEIIPGYPEDEWESITLEAKPSYEKGWKHKGELVCVFSNFTDEIRTADSVQIFRDYGDSFAEMPFSDGSTILQIDFSVDPGIETDFVLTDDMFPYEKCEPGIYKAVFDCSGEKLEQTFFINYPYADNPDYQSYYELSLNFLTEEQNQLFKNTVAEINDEISFGRGHARTVFGACFEPLYSDENEVLFKNTVIHAYEYSYFIWFEELNYHMVRTDDGWKFDNFQLWY